MREISRTGRPRIGIISYQISCILRRFRSYNNFLVLAANTLLVFAESWLDLSDTLSPTGEEAFAVCECLFSIVYMGLLVAQLAVIPFDEFWLEPTNRFDAFVTTILFVVAFFWCLPFIDISRATLHRLTILRLLRLVARLRRSSGLSW